MRDKKVLLGVTGGIAAYKSAVLVRELKSRGAQVRVVMSHSAQQFVTGLTFQALSGEPVHSELLDSNAEAAMGHIELAKWADVLLIAPASAHFIAQHAHGMAGDLLTTLCLASEAPLVIAPAMNQAMWRNLATQSNVETLSSRGVQFIGPAQGEQACGDIGPGRMSEVCEIVEQLDALLVSLNVGTKLKNKRVLITAGPTREAIDPVRYISNYSSGKMGFALAEAAALEGAEVILVHGPVNLSVPKNVTAIAINSAQEMLNLCTEHCDELDIFIGSAAVADYRPLTKSDHKLKKDNNNETITLELTKNPDIVASIAALSPKPFTVGFAAETKNVLEYAQEKLARKGLDMIIANDVSDASIGFNSDENAVTVISKDDHKVFEKCSKRELARKLIAEIAIQQASR